MSETKEATPSDLIDAPHNAAARQRQEEVWKHTNVDVRQQLHQREAQLAHKNRVLECIHYYKICVLLLDALTDNGCPFSKLSLDTVSHIAGFWFHGNQTRLIRNIHQRRQLSTPNTSNTFRLYLRARPLLQFEIDAKEYAVVEVARNGRSCICHKGMLSRTGKRLNVSHLEYMFDQVWSGNTRQQEVTEIALTPLLDHALQSGHSTLLCFGQTGTGKTYTLTQCLQSVVRRVSALFAPNQQCSPAIHGIEINFYEIHGKKAYDLLAQRHPVRLMSDAQEVVHVRGAQCIALTPGNCHQEGTTVAKKLSQILQQGLALRSIEVTERNPISSRSHAICNITFQPTGGCITLVDLAGSERNYETVKMTPAMHRESAEINKALGALKDCFRCFHSNLKKGQQERKNKKLLKAPYRHSMLTRVLKRCFEGTAHRTAIVATISPTTTDLEHTLNTLKHVRLMAPLTPPPPSSGGSSNTERKIKVTSRRPTRTKKTRKGRSSGGGGGGGGGHGNGTCATTNVPVSERESNASYFGKLVHLWTHHDVQQWLGTVDGGRFAHVVFPKHVTGEHLMQLGAKSMTTLFQGIVGDRVARASGEGGAWTIGVDDGVLSSTSSMEALGRQIWRALRNEQQNSITGKLGLPG